MVTALHVPVPGSDEASELEMIRDTARRFFAEEVAPHCARWEKQGHVDPDLWRKAGDAGLLCPMVKTENSGFGGDIRYSRIMTCSPEVMPLVS